MNNATDLKQLQVREWMEKNRRRLSRFSFVQPSLKDPICKDPLFKPLLLAEIVFKDDMDYQKYWFLKLASQEEKHSLKEINKDYKSSSFTEPYDEHNFIVLNLYLQEHGLLYPFYWDPIKFESSRLIASSNVWYINVRDHTDKKYQIALFNNQIYVKSYSISKVYTSNKDGYYCFNEPTDLFKKHTFPFIMSEALRTDLKDVAFEDYADTSGIDKPTIDHTFDVLMQLPLNIEMFRNTSLVEPFLKECSDPDAEIKFISKLTGADLNSVKYILTLHTDYLFTEIVDIVAACSNSANSNEITLPVFE